MSRLDPRLQELALDARAGSLWHMRAGVAIPRIKTSTSRWNYQELLPKSPNPMVIKLTKQKYAPSRKVQSSHAENIAPPLRR